MYIFLVQFFPEPINKKTIKQLIENVNIRVRSTQFPNPKTWNKPREVDMPLQTNNESFKFSLVIEISIFLTDFYYGIEFDFGSRF